VETAGRELFMGEHAGGLRPSHGALLVNLRNILESLDAVAEAQPVQADVRAHAMR
jgi:hypothetical protein